MKSGRDIVFVSWYIKKGWVIFIVSIVIVELVESIELPLQTDYNHQEPLVSTEFSHKQLEKSTMPGSKTLITTGR